MQCFQQQDKEDRTKSCKKHINIIKIKSNNASATHNQDKYSHNCGGKDKEMHRMKYHVNCLLSFWQTFCHCYFPCFKLVGWRKWCGGRPKIEDSSSADCYSYWEKTDDKFCYWIIEGNTNENNRPIIHDKKMFNKLLCFSVVLMQKVSLILYFIFSCISNFLRAWNNFFISY